MLTIFWKNTLVTFLHICMTSHQFQENIWVYKWSIYNINSFIINVMQMLCNGSIREWVVSYYIHCKCEEGIYNANVLSELWTKSKCFLWGRGRVELKAECKYQDTKEKIFLGTWLWRLKCMDTEKEKGFANKFTAGRLLLMPFNSSMCETISYHKMNH